MKLEKSVTKATEGLVETDRLQTEVQNLKEEWDRLLEEKKRSEEDLPKLLEKAGDAGYNEAGEHYKKQVEGLVNKAFKEREIKGVEETHNSSFLLGYHVLDYAEVPKVNH